MPLSVRQGGSWKEPDKIYVTDSGVWKEVQKVSIRDSGSWQETFTAFTLSVTCDPADCEDLDIVAKGSNAVATVDLFANTSVSWSFQKVSGANATLGPSSGSSSSLSIARSTVGTSQAVYDITASASGQQIVTRVTVTAEVIIIAILAIIGAIIFLIRRSDNETVDFLMNGAVNRDVETPDLLDEQVPGFPNN